MTTICDVKGCRKKGSNIGDFKNLEFESYDICEEHTDKIEKMIKKGF